MNCRPALTKNEMRPTTRAEILGRDLAGRLHRVEHGDAGGQREGQFLHRRRAGFLQVVGADVGRVPLRHFLVAEKTIVSLISRSDGSGGNT